MDIITAIPYGFLDEEIYIMQPTIFEDGTTWVCFLKKALYGLKQSPRVWYQTLLDFFGSSIFIRWKPTMVYFSQQTKLCLYLSIWTTYSFLVLILTPA